MSKILIIDDSEIDRLITGELLSRQRDSLEIYKVSSGQEAIDFLTDHQGDFFADLIILLDIMMPGMNGFEFLDAFDELIVEKKEDIRIVMLSTTMDKRDKKKAEDHPNVQVLLEKPLKIAELDPYLDI